MDKDPALRLYDVIVRFESVVRLLRERIPKRQKVGLWLAPISCSQPQQFSPHHKRTIFALFTALCSVLVRHFSSYESSCSHTLSPVVPYWSCPPFSPSSLHKSLDHVAASEASCLSLDRDCQVQCRPCDVQLFHMSICFLCCQSSTCVLEHPRIRGRQLLLAFQHELALQQDFHRLGGHHSST